MDTLIDTRIKATRICRNIAPTLFLIQDAQSPREGWDIRKARDCGGIAPQEPNGYGCFSSVTRPVILSASTTQPPPIAL